MANEYLVKGESLTAVADKIRILNGTTEAMSLDEMAAALDGIEIGVELPELSNPASAEEVFLNKEFIDEDGNSVTGTFSIDNELSNQDSLISQIQTALQNKAAATGEDVTDETNAYTTKLATLETAITALETELQGKASGGSGGGSVETCTVTVNAEGVGADYLCATTMNNGQLGSYVFNGRGSNTENTLAIENVVCGSTIGLCAQVVMPIASFSNGGELIDCGAGYFTLKAPTEAGVSTTVNIYTDPDW